MKVSIVDYGMGNIKSVSNALDFLDAEPLIASEPEDIEGDHIIIPGVGAFGDAMESFEPFLPRINRSIDSGVPILGICLGMQLFFETSEESPDTKGISALKGRVTRPLTDLRLPQIGWNSIEVRKDDCRLFDGIDDGYVYYAHSYHVETREDVVAATSDYGIEITASVWRDNLYGTQFHPEKSGKLGLKILKNFLEL